MKRFRSVIRLSALNRVPPANIRPNAVCGQWCSYQGVGISFLNKNS
jgi:hypothetical protein